MCLSVAHRRLRRSPLYIMHLHSVSACAYLWRTVACVAVFYRQCICMMYLHLPVCGAPSLVSQTFEAYCICILYLYVSVCGAPSFVSQPFHTRSVAHCRLHRRHLILLSLHVMFLHVSVVVALPSVDPHVYLCGATSDCIAYSHSFVYVYCASFEFVAVAVSRVSRPRLCTVSL